MPLTVAVAQVVVPISDADTVTVVIGGQISIGKHFFGDNQRQQWLMPAPLVFVRQKSIATDSNEVTKRKDERAEPTITRQPKLIARA